MMDETLARLAVAAGWPDSDVYAAAAQLESKYKGGRANEGIPHPKTPPAVRRAIEALNSVDMQLYSYAVQLFLRQRPPNPSNSASPSTVSVKS